MGSNLLEELSKNDILITPEAYEKLKDLDNSDKEIISKLKDYVERNLEFPLITNEIVEEVFIEKKPQVPKIKIKKKRSKLEIIKNIESLNSDGDIKNLLNYFHNRYEKLRGLLEKRLGKIVDIKDIGDNEVKIAGIVNEVRTTKKNHKIIELEDKTGKCIVFVNKDGDLFKKTENIVQDEVIGVIGKKNGRFVTASEIIQPGIPRIEEKNSNCTILFLSDLHIGSSKFLENSFEKLISWINEGGNIAGEIEYIIIAGDIVDGVGIYPGQEKELAIKDIEGQYEEAARLLGEIRKDIKIIIAPGNHDASRIAEPQQPLEKEYAKALYDLPNAEFVSNPSIICIDGLKIMIYHGRSFDDMAISANFSHDKPAEIMAELLEKRHLAPIYGLRTPIAPEPEDHLVIDTIPDIFHAGHVHINDYKKYKGIHLINSGTFQEQTEFQKIHNIRPTPGQVPVLHNSKIKVLSVEKLPAT
ncbi:DNA polymerase II small subunit [Methanothermus fervidus DSM 2088]|uniref:DNA polymerase II small subunit n=1 Tax=Methanothermus fervidus (strain ATCC 43054 / DSM 2088 / JCM 10308 / V24 S) TaxID=523846 RepID=E3GWQ4_METFV|nr:DNA-directed DNA polymerase II small subunit [Methanothermus fervidus]ADP77973.1 DNA polymerase II small subunit [Methanothermus fervidus DSM 2088]